MRGGSVIRTIPALGPIHAARYWAQWARSRRTHDHDLFAITSKALRHPVFYRANTSDLRVFYQVVLRDDYACVGELQNTDVVLDCGANAGYASVVFLNRFPNCRVIAVEPDPETFKILARNLAPYGDRAVALNAAVWSHKTRLSLGNDHADGEAWARQTRDRGGDGDGDVEALAVPDLIAVANASRVGLLKVDIEGAEAVVFAGSPVWLEQVDVVVAELHGHQDAFGDTEKPFYDAIAQHGFHTKQYGENIVCRR